MIPESERSRTVCKSSYEQAKTNYLRGRNNKSSKALYALASRITKEKVCDGKVT